MDSAGAAPQAGGMENRTSRTDPAMLLQRPSSARAQDITHLLNNMFRDVCAHDPLDPDTIQNLIRSRGSDDIVHEQYVSALEQVQLDKERRYAQCAALERHIMQAEAKAQYAHSRETRRRNQSASSASGKQQYNLEELGVQPVYSHYRSVVDEKLLQRNGLITPSDYTRLDDYQAKQQRDHDQGLDRTQSRKSQTSVSNRRSADLKAVSATTTQQKISSATTQAKTLASAVTQTKTGLSTKVVSSAATRMKSGVPIDSVPLETDLEIQADSDSNSDLDADEAAGSQLRGLVESTSGGDQPQPRYRDLPRGPHSATYSASVRGLSRKGSQQDAPKRKSRNAPSILELAERYKDELRDIWKSQISNEDRELARQVLRSMYARNRDFHKNPRFEPAGTRLLLRNTVLPDALLGLGVTNDSYVFFPEPKTVLFDKYQIGQTYEQELRLTNVTNTMRSIRVVPPATQYFSVGLGRFPEGGGLVAPGMCCAYAVRFAPDCLGEFSDVLVVQVSGVPDLRIPLVGRRPAPRLRINTTLDCGECVLLGTKVVRFAVRNDGGDGRFCVLAASQWPPSASLAGAIQPGGLVSVGAFEIRPAAFQLSAGQSAVLEVLFVPLKTGVHEENFVVLCDNCQTRRFRLVGRGQLACVSLAGVQDGLADYLPTEPRDITAQHLVRFDPLHPFTFSQRRITVRNPNAIQFAFNWKLIKPAFVYPSGLGGETDRVEPPAERIIDVNSAFAIEPSSGVLESLGEMEFQVTFAPTEVRRFDSVGHLLLENIPDYGAYLAAQALARATQSASKPSTPNTDRQSRKSRHSMEEIPSSDSQPSNNNTAVTGGAQVLVTEVTVLEVELVGNCVPFAIEFDPPALVLSSQQYVGVTVKRPIRVRNAGFTTVSCAWQSAVTPDYIINVESAFGMLRARGGEAVLDVCVTGLTVGKHRHSVRCALNRDDSPSDVEPLGDCVIELPVEFTVCGAEIETDCGGLDFGLVRLTESRTLQFQLRNPSPIIANWHVVHEYLDETEGAKNSNSDRNYAVSVNAPHGALRPLETFAVSVQLDAKKTGRIDSSLIIQVANGNRLTLTLTGEIQTPFVYLVDSVIRPEPVFLEVPSQRTVQLHNATLLDTSFFFEKPVGDDHEYLEIRVEPPAGIIAGHQTLDITVNFTAHKLGTVQDFEVPCVLMDAANSCVQTLKVRIECEVEDLRFTATWFKVESVETKRRLDKSGRAKAQVRRTRVRPVDDPDCVDLGTYELDTHDADAKRIPIAYLRLRNDTAIPTTYKIDPPHFASALSKADIVGKYPELRKMIFMHPDLDWRTESESDAYSRDFTALTATLRAADDSEDPSDGADGKKSQMDLHAQLARAVATLTERSRTEVTSAASRSVDPRGVPAGVVPPLGRKNVELVLKSRGKEAPFALRDCFSEILGLKKGAAFLISPCEGRLDAYEQVIVEIRAFADMWGKYEDMLTIHVGQICREIPLKFEAVGCPLDAQITANVCDREALCVLRLGAHLVGEQQPFLRAVKLNNHSPFDLRVDWRTFHMFEEDRKLLDLVTTFGRPFPPAVDDVGLDSERNWESESSRVDAESRPRLIRLILRPRDGFESPVARDDQGLSLFSIRPPQLTIPAKSQVVVQACLDSRQPAVEQYLEDARTCAKDAVTARERLTSNGVDVVSYALGYISIDDPAVRCVDGKVTRADAYDAAQFRIDATARVVDPLLEYTFSADENELLSEKVVEFVAYASDFFDSQRKKMVILARNTLSIRNERDTPTFVSISTATPFGIVEGSTRSDADSDWQAQLPRVKIPIRGTTKINIALLGSKKLVQLVEQLASGQLDSSLPVSEPTLSHLQPRYVNEDGAWPPPFRRLRKYKVEVQPQPLPQTTPTLGEASRLDSTRKNTSERSSKKDRDDVSSKRTDPSSKKDSETGGVKRSHSDAHSHSHSKKEDSETGSKKQHSDAGSKRETSGTPSKRHGADSSLKTHSREETEHDISPKYEIREEWVEDPIAFQQQIRSRRLECELPLDITTTTGHRDSFTMLMRFELPAVKLSCELIDFSTCFCSQTRELNVTIVNVGLSDAQWSIEQESNRGVASNKDPVFDLKPDSGRLPGLRSTKAHNRQTIRILFTAAHDVPYETVYRIVGPFISEPIRLLVKGIGSFDSKYKQTYGL